MIVSEQIYPDAVIEFCLLVKYLYHLPLGQTIGFIEDLLVSQGCIGEWLVKKHEASKHRTWLKLHICIDAMTQEIIAMSLTNNSIDDAHAAKDMLEEHQLCLASLGGDGAYDKFFFRESLELDVLQKIPPPCNAILKKGSQKAPLPAYLVQRNQAIERIEEKS